MILALVLAILVGAATIALCNPLPSKYRTSVSEFSGAKIWRLDENGFTIGDPVPIRSGTVILRQKNSGNMWSRWLESIQ